MDIVKVAVIGIAGVMLSIIMKTAAVNMHSLWHL